MLVLYSNVIHRGGLRVGSHSILKEPRQSLFRLFPPLIPFCFPLGNLVATPSETNPVPRWTPGWPFCDSSWRHCPSLGPPVSRVFRPSSRKAFLHFLCRTSLARRALLMSHSTFSPFLPPSRDRQHCSVPTEVGVGVPATVRYMLL